MTIVLSWAILRGDDGSDVSVWSFSLRFLLFILVWPCLRPVELRWTGGHVRAARDRRAAELSFE